MILAFLLFIGHTIPGPESVMKASRLKEKSQNKSSIPFTFHALGFGNQKPNDRCLASVIFNAIVLISEVHGGRCCSRSIMRFKWLSPRNSLLSAEGAGVSGAVVRAVQLLSSLPFKINNDGPWLLVPCCLTSDPLSGEGGYVLARCNESRKRNLPCGRFPRRSLIKCLESLEGWCKSSHLFASQCSLTVTRPTNRWNRLDRYPLRPTSIIKIWDEGRCKKVCLKARSPWPSHECMQSKVHASSSRPVRASSCEQETATVREKPGDSSEMSDCWARSHVGISSCWYNSCFALFLWLPSKMVFAMK